MMKCQNIDICFAPQNRWSFSLVREQWVTYRPRASNDTTNMFQLKGCIFVSFAMSNADIGSLGSLAKHLLVWIIMGSSATSSACYPLSPIQVIWKLFS